MFRRRTRKPPQGLADIPEPAFNAAIYTAQKLGFRIYKEVVRQNCDDEDIRASAEAFLLTDASDTPRLAAYVAATTSGILFAYPHSDGAVAVDREQFIELRVDEDLYLPYEPALDDYEQPWMAQWLGEEPFGMKLTYKDRSHGGPASRTIQFVVGSEDVASSRHSSKHCWSLLSKPPRRQPPGQAGPRRDAPTTTTIRPADREFG